MSTSQVVRIAAAELFRELPESRRYRIESTGNGMFTTITRLSDGSSVFLQGDESATFAELLETTNDSYTDDDAAAEYFA